MLLNYNEIEGTDFVAIDNYSEDIDIEDLINSCKLKFEKEKKNGTIRTGEFEDNIWVVNDGVTDSNIVFNTDEVTYKKFGKPLPYKTFMDLHKSYTLGLFRTASMETVKKVSRDIYTILVDSEFLNLNYLDVIKEKAIKCHDSHLGSFVKSLDFFKLIPDQEVSEFIDEISDYIKFSDKKSTSGLVQNRRNIPDYYSILLFEKMLENWWTSEINLNERVYFYPVYLWWKITSILPLRPTEFTLTPYNCIKEEDGEFYITIRRSNSKGKKYTGTAKFHYDINKDYKKMTYKINKDIYELIKAYKELSSLDKFKNKFCDENDVLLNNIMHKHYSNLYNNRKEPTTETFENIYVFKAHTLTSLLTIFYNKIIKERYGLKLRDYNISDQELYSFKSIELKEISMLKLGDTRHIALINMCLNDINPILIRDFVNHDNINTTYHYIENTKQFVKCVTHMQYRKLKRDTTSSAFNLQFDSDINVNILLDKPKRYVDVDNGKCYSKNFIKGSIKDCMNSDIEIGSCRGCEFFIRDTALSDDEITSILKECDDKLERESNFLISELKRFVSDNNTSTKEDMEVSIMKLKTAILQHKKVIESIISEEQNGR